MKIKSLIVLFLFFYASQVQAQDFFLLSQDSSVFGYYKSGGHDAELNAIIDEVIPYLEKIPVEKGKTAIVFDLDETLLSNVVLYEEIADGKIAFVDSTWGWWVRGLNSFALPTKRLYDYVVERGFVIIFITGSDDNLQGYIAENLKRNGFDTYNEFICRPKEFYNSTAFEYKSYFRKKLTEEKGYNIVANAGDQYSDMGGGYSGMFIRIPNYVYYIK
jgi:hypothetical protein